MQVSVVLFRFGNFIKLGKSHKVHAKLQQRNALIDYCREACLSFSVTLLFAIFSNFFRARLFLISLSAHEERGALNWGFREGQSTLDTTLLRYQASHRQSVLAIAVAVVDVFVRVHTGRIHVQVIHVSATVAGRRPPAAADTLISRSITIVVA